MSALQVLKEARKLLSEEKNWTQGVYARDGLGKPCPTVGAAASSFCLIGALEKVCHGHDELRNAETFLNNLTGVDLPSFNDHNSHQQVIELLDRAIGQLEI